MTSRAFNHLTVADLGEDGIWTVKMMMQEGRKEDGSDWNKRTISVQISDKDIDIAYALCANNLMDRFKQIGEDLFNLDKENDGSEFSNPIASDKTSGE